MRRDASLPGIQESQELESWISIIEPATSAATSKAYIKVSRYVWSVLNSPVFASIKDWVSFKAQLLDQFWGMATAQHFHDMLAQVRMAVDQGCWTSSMPWSWQCSRACKTTPGHWNAEDLMLCSFCKGLPGSAFLA